MVQFPGLGTPACGGHSLNQSINQTINQPSSFLVRGHHQLHQSLRGPWAHKSDSRGRIYYPFTNPLGDTFVASQSYDALPSKRISPLLSWTSIIRTNPTIDIFKGDYFILSLNNTHHMKDLYYSIYLTLNLFFHQWTNVPSTILNALHILTFNSQQP